MGLQGTAGKDGEAGVAGPPGLTGPAGILRTQKNLRNWSACFNLRFKRRERLPWRKRTCWNTRYPWTKRRTWCSRRWWTFSKQFLFKEYLREILKNNYTGRVRRERWQRTFWTIWYCGKWTYKLKFTFHNKLILYPRVCLVSVVYLELQEKRVTEETVEILELKVHRVDKEKGVFQEW